MTDTPNLGTIWVVGQRRAPGGNFLRPAARAAAAPAKTAGFTRTRLIPTAEVRTDRPFTLAQARTPLLSGVRTPRRRKQQGNCPARWRDEPARDPRWARMGLLPLSGFGWIHPLGSDHIWTALQHGGRWNRQPFLRRIDPSTIIGSVHSHTSGNHLPSSGNPDSPGDIQHLEGMVAFSGNSSARLYIVARNQGPAGFEPYNQINVYNQDTAQEARDTFTPGPEVNPEGTPCT